MGKGEIAPHEQFLLFPQCFHKACLPGASKGVIEWEWVKEFADYYNLNVAQMMNSASSIVVNMKKKKFFSQNVFECFLI